MKKNFLNEGFRRFVYYFLGLLFKNTNIAPPIEKSLARKILIFRYDVIGDMIVSLPSFNFIRKILPNSELWVLCSEINYIILQGNMDVNKVIVYPSSLLGKIKLISQLRKEKFDVIINYVFNKTTKAGFLANCISPKAVKVNIGHQTRNEIYNKLFNLIIPLELLGNLYMSKLLSKYVSNIFGINGVDDSLTKYWIKIPEKNYQYALQLRSKIHYQNLLFFNISAGSKKRMWDFRRYIELLKMLSINFPKLGILVSSHRKDKNLVREIHKENVKNVVCLSYSESIWNTIAIISLCDFVFTPDTSIVHIATMMNKPSVYLMSSKITDIKIWAPEPECNRTIFSQLEKYKDISTKKVYEELSSLILSATNNFS